MLLLQGEATQTQGLTALVSHGTPESCPVRRSTCSLLPDTAFWNVQHCLSGRDCFGVLDCEWCMVDSDGKTHLDKSYCAPQKECFGGIVGAKSPYVDDMGAIGNVLREPRMT